MKKAICWYERAAEQNHPAAMNSLGECYAMGQGVPLDLKRPWNGIARGGAGRSHGGLQHGMAFEQAGSCLRRIPITAKLPMGMTTAPGGRWGVL